MQNRLFRSFSLIAAFILTLTLFSGCGKKTDSVTVLLLDDYAVSAEEYEYFYYNFLSSLQYESVTSDDVRAQVEAALRQRYAVRKLAAQYEITVGDDDQENIDRDIASLEESYGGKSELDQALTEWHMNRAFLRELLSDTYLETALRAYLSDPYKSDIPADDDTVRQDALSHFYHAKQILISHEEGDDLVANYTLAESLLERAEAGEDFDDLIAQYGEDSYMELHPEGYYFTDGQLLTEFEDAVLALHEGEFSPVVMSEVGYHVILRLPLEEAEIDAQLDSIRAAYLSRTVNTRLAETGAAMKLIYADAFDTLQLETMPG